jgi:hypothetical protein
LDAGHDARGTMPLSSMVVSSYVHVW